MKILMPPQSGSHTNITSSRNRFGQYVRARAIPTQPRTPAQTGVRAALSSASLGWKSLTLAQMMAWSALAANLPLKDSLGQTYYQTGAMLYTGCAVRQTALGLSISPDAPTFPITPGTGTLALTWNAMTSVVGLALAMSGGTGYENMTAAVFCTKPRSPGVAFHSDYRLIETIAGTTGGDFNDAALNTSIVAKWGSIVVPAVYGIKVVISIDGLALQTQTAVLSTS